MGAGRCRRFASAVRTSPLISVVRAQAQAPAAQVNNPSASAQSQDHKLRTGGPAFFLSSFTHSPSETAPTGTARFSNPSLTNQHAATSNHQPCLARNIFPLLHVCDFES